MNKFFLFLFLVFLLLFFSQKIFALNMESPLYKIQYGEIGIAGGKKSSDSYQLSDTLGQLAAGEFQSNGYIIKAGFQYLYSIIPFRFSISDTRIDLGTLLPNTPSTASTTLTVSFGASGQYLVTAIEEGKLRTLNEQNFIPDTQCDGGINTCNETQAKIWTSNNAYGFGYNMNGQDIPTDFINTNYYRPFPDRNNNEDPAIVMSSTNVGKNRQSTMTFKVNISSIQPAGSYQTVINFVATPSY
ncbi:MAG: hypothetical protein N2482_03320 [Patescibacteria group bacterium]|nr:hypothetical protein [Patescibacteria group bacterium]